MKVYSSSEVDAFNEGHKRGMEDGYWSAWIAGLLWGCFVGLVSTFLALIWNRS